MNLWRLSMIVGLPLAWFTAGLAGYLIGRAVA